MFKVSMTRIVVLAMRNQVVNFCTYKGYDGANILKMEFREKAILDKIREFSRSLGFKDNTKGNTLYVIVEEPDDVYSLK